MGLAVDIHRLLIGTQCTIDEFRNVPTLCQRLEPAGWHDAAYVWRNTHVTGAIDIHEMATGADGAWYFIKPLSPVCAGWTTSTASYRYGGPGSCPAMRRRIAVI
jgi:hypothetical protein